jgi:ATP-dependent Clp protease ATP-binding subunit ClpB
MVSLTGESVRDYLIRGSDYLELTPNFSLVGREDTRRKLTGILMRKSANSVLLVGPGGVGCSAICRGLQKSKENPDSPFDIVSKRFFWLDSDGLFSSGDPNRINNSFEKTIKRMSRTPNTVLILDDMRDFIDAARNNGTTNLINWLMRAIRQGKFQVIMETRDEDLETVLRCHSDMKERYTVLDIREPEPEVLRVIVQAAAEVQLKPHHKIRISQEAIDTAIDVTSKYRVQDLGLSRAQPERSITLLDRALTSYRLEAHGADPKMEALQAQQRALEARLAEAGDAAESGSGPAAQIQSELADLSAEIQLLETAWNTRQEEIRRLYQEMREGEEAIRGLEDDLEVQLLEEERRNLNASGAAEDTESEDPEKKASFVSFATRAATGGYESEAVSGIKRRMADFQQEVDRYRQSFEELTSSINDKLKLQKEHILAEFSSISGIPVSKLTEDERVKLLHLDANLKQRVFGQEEAITMLANQVRVARAGLQSPNKPQASFMFLGPSGVGKTELAKALTAELYDERALLRFDMSEYMEKHAVAKLIGAPPGYEGYEAGGILTNEMRRNPRRIILFDEIEKAHDDIFNVFLQILDDARLTDNRGLTVSFRDAVILMTTNIGTKHFLSVEDFDEAKGRALEDLDEQYRPEFLARFNGKRNIVCFRPLDLPIIEKIAARDLAKLNLMVKESLPDIDIEMKHKALAAMCRDHYRPITGARGITGYIEGVIKPEIATTVLFNPESAGTIFIDYDEETQSVVMHPPQVIAASSTGKPDD